MSYQGFLIANYATGFDREVQPWLLPEESQFTLFDGFVYRGVWQKREGYQQYAFGERGGLPYCESRMVHTITIAANEVPNNIITHFTFTIPGTAKPLRRGGFRAQDFTALGVQAQIIQDNGVGGTLGGSNGIITTVLNYTTVLATPQAVTFTVAPNVGHTVTLSLDYHPGFPVMGVMNYYTPSQTKELIVADTTYVNRYNSTTNRLEDISPGTPYTGTKKNFWSWVNYNDPNNNERLLFVNNKNQIQMYQGSTVSNYIVYTAQGAAIPSGAYGVGNGTVGPYTFTAGANTGILRGPVVITAGAQVISFDQFGNVSGDGTGTINFMTGSVSVTFTAIVPGATPITISYTPLTTPIDTCLHIFQLKDRLLVLRPIINGKTFSKRFLISGTGAFCDTFTSGAVGAGVIDIPDDSYIVSADFNRDDLLIFTALATWIVKYTNNDVVPFTLDKIDNSRGSDSPFGSESYLNSTSASSTRGFIICDGYTVSRSDDKIPDYSYNSINQDNFNLCFAGKVDIDRDHYLIHPSANQDDSTAISDTILVYNYEELNYSQYRIPLSCMGNYIESFTITWNDLSIYDTWEEMAAVYTSWNAFAYSKGAPIAIGGGHNGQIFQLNTAESEDYDVRIRNITYIDSSTIQVTTDYQNYKLNDYIVLQGITGIPQLNNKQGYITNVNANHYTFNLNVGQIAWDPLAYTYTGSGTAYNVIVFQSKTKKFNPFADQDKKVRCGWLYFYVSTTGTSLTDNQYIVNAIQTTINDDCIITIPGNGYANNTLVEIDGVQGMTELNGNSYFITVVDNDNFTLNGTAGTALSTYTGGGYCATPTLPKLLVNCITNDDDQSTVVNGFNPDPYQVNLAEIISKVGVKKWYKLWINQTGRFIQFEVISNQAGAKIQIQAMMPGFQPVGRLI